jgi:hypothetical protein
MKRENNHFAKTFIYEPIRLADLCNLTRKSKNMKKKKGDYGVELSTLVFLLGFQGLAYLSL